MSYFKTLICIVFVLRAFLSFGEFSSSDSEALNEIFRYVEGMAKIQPTLLQAIVDRGYSLLNDTTAIQNYLNDIKGNQTQIAIDLEAKLDSIHATLKNISYSNWTYEDILDVKEKLDILNDMRTDIRDIGDDVYLIHKDVRSILTDTGFIQSDVEDIRNFLNQLPSFMSASLENQNTIIQYIKYANDNMFAGKSEDDLSLYKIVESMYNDVHAVTNYFAQYEQYLSTLQEAVVETDDDFSYINVSNITQSVPYYLDLSIITNSILGSSFLGPWEMENEGGAAYYTLYQRFKNGEIDTATYIAEMGLYNWLAGLNFGDWWVTAPDGADLEDTERWGIVENAKIEWGPLAEYTAFPPYSSSDARFWLYGTRDLTDNSTNLNVYLPYLVNLTNRTDYLIAELIETNNLYFAELNEMMKTNLFYQLYQGRYLNRILANNMSMDSHLAKIEQYTKDLPTLVKLMQGWNEDNGEPDQDENLDVKPDKLEEPPANIEEALPDVNNILATDVPEDSVNQAVSFINEAKATFDYEVGEADDFFIPIDLDIFGVEVGFDIEIEDLDKFQAMWGKIAKFITALFKITTMIIVARCTIKTFMSDMNNVELF